MNWHIRYRIDIKKARKYVIVILLNKLVKLFPTCNHWFY